MVNFILLQDQCITREFTIYFTNSIHMVRCGETYHGLIQYHMILLIGFILSLQSTHRTLLTSMAAGLVQLHFFPGKNLPFCTLEIDIKNRQVQNLAVPKNVSDPLLIEWVKSPHNPLLTPIDDIDPQNFRDPTTAWQGPDRVWRVIVGSKINGSGMAILYRSRDFVEWIRSDNPLHSSTKTGMWECPDFYPVSANNTNGEEKFSKHVLKASFKNQDHYILGNYMPMTDKFEVDTDFLDEGLDLRYDYGNFYASKTFYDSGKKSRILWGWVIESDSESDDIEKGWSGLQVIQV
jgi:beta-fructofuranosidase